jgi:hypothetical protein
LFIKLVEKKTDTNNNSSSISISSRIVAANEQEKNTVGELAHEKKKEILKEEFW